MAIEISQIYLSIICGIFVILSFTINFTFLVTLLKLRRLNKSDKSSFFLTHLILADFVCALFVLIPSGFGVYKGDLGNGTCHMQVFFFTFYLSLTFYGLLALSIERFFKYKYPLSHINFFTKRTSMNNDGVYIPGKSLLHKTILIVIGLWLLNLFIGLIPLFNNLNDVEYFKIQSQCDYRYESDGFSWWLWFFFWISLTIPFLASLIFFSLTLKLIVDNAVIINNRQNQARTNQKQRPVQFKTAAFVCELFFPRIGRKKKAAEKFVTNKFNKDAKYKHQHKVSDTTKLPENLAYYSHLINIENLDDQYENMYNDVHVRKQLLIQFKYDTERSKTTTFFIITILTYCFVFPLYVIHFYRTFNFDGTTYDNPQIVARNTYSTFVWIAYITFILKSGICLLHNKFYRYSLYQSANFRGFHGDFDYEVEKFKKELKMYENRMFADEQASRSKSKSHQKLINSSQA